jgi:glycosyltransferase involved in cell wall biosynthesis
MNRINRARRKQVVKELYIDEEGLSSKFATRFYRWAFKDLSLIITNSSGEIPYMMNWLQLPDERFRFLPWPSSIGVEENTSTLSDYIFAGGSSFRDWETFFEAVQCMNVKCVIVASKKDIFNVRLPNGIEVHCDIPHKEYLNLLRRAKVVVIPLKNTFRSVGQAVILEAMALGKPIICARVAGVLDYINPEVNGIYYRPGDPQSLRKAILRLLDDNELQQRLGRTAQKSIQDRFNRYHYSTAMLEAMKKVCFPEG